MWNRRLRRPAEGNASADQVRRSRSPVGTGWPALDADHAPADQGRPPACGASRAPASGEGHAAPGREGRAAPGRKGHAVAGGEDCTVAGREDRIVAGGEGRAVTRTGPLAPGQPRGTSAGRSRRMLAIAAAGALACALLGGLVGGYVGVRSVAGGIQPDFTLGSAPAAVTGRPPSSIAAVAARVLPSVVMVMVNGSQGTGSGFVISGGYIVTENHVVTLDGQTPGASLQVVFDGGATAPARLVGRDPYSDLAVIRAGRVRGLRALTLGDSASVQVGDQVLAVGSPLGLAGTVTSGIVSAVSRPVQPGSGIGSAPQAYYDAIQTDAPINPGNSGGPLVNSHGLVIGVNSAIDTLGGNPLTGAQGGSIGLGFAIPANQVRLVVTELIRTGRAAHAVIGAQLNTAFHGNGAQIARATSGASATISPGGPAARAGLRPGDVIIRLGGQHIGNASALLDAIRSRPPGARVEVTFTRKGAARTVAVTLGSALS